MNGVRLHSDRVTPALSDWLTEALGGREIGDFQLIIRDDAGTTVAVYLADDDENRRPPIVVLTTSDPIVYMIDGEAGDLIFSFVHPDDPQDDPCASVKGFRSEQREFVRNLISKLADSLA